MSNEDLSQTIAKLRADYAAQLPEAVAQMDQLWQRLVTAALPPTKLADLARMAHSITGSGTTFGLPHASRAARELELYLDKFADSGRLPGAEDQQRISALLAALRQAAAQQ